VHSEGTATQAEATAQQIKRLTVRFSESETLKESLKKANFVAVDSL
jgi:ribosomal protein S9